MPIGQSGVRILLLLLSTIGKLVTYIENFFIVDIALYLYKLSFGI